MSVDWNAIGGITTIVQFLGVLVVAVIFWKARNEFASKKEIETIRQRVDSHGIRLTQLETETRHYPTSSDIHALATAMESLRGDINVAVERVSGVKEDLDRMENTLMRHEDILSTAAREAKR